MFEDVTGKPAEAEDGLLKRPILSTRIDNQLSWTSLREVLGECNFTKPRSKAVSV